MNIKDLRTNHRIIRGDSRHMEELREQSVQLIITSPPYWQLKDYGSTRQIGYYDSYEKYINDLNLVWQECYRVLSDGCRLCINIGDQFARSVYYGRYKVIPIRTEIIKFCETIGFDYMGAIIWQKSTTMNTTGGAVIMGSYPFPRNGIIKMDYEFILLFKKRGTAPKTDKTKKDLSILTKEEWNIYFRGHWNFSGVKQEEHIAMFPEELPKRLIKMFSFVSDTVLDPFLGSGTTALAAKNLNRNSAGYEINTNFIKTIKDKLGAGQENLFEHADLLFNEQGNLDIDFEKRVLELPYIFRDPVQIDKKADPKKLSFGSRIDENKMQKDQYYTVKEIIDPETVMLNNDLLIKLLGVKNNPGKANEAVTFLKEKFDGQRVFLKFDRHKYDGGNNLLCYLYLENKTFINAHLIKSKLVDVDFLSDYKNKTKFLALSKK